MGNEVKVKTFTVHEFRVTVDERSDSVYGYYTDLMVGKSASKGKGWYGSDGYSRSTRDVIEFYHNGERYQFLLKDRITVIETIEDEEEKRRREKLSRITGKLTPDELEFLLANSKK